jgi:hypothetical protein
MASTAVIRSRQGWEQEARWDFGDQRFPAAVWRTDCRWGPGKQRHNKNATAPGERGWWSVHTY